MRDIQVVNDAALLVHDGVVRDLGPARRIENLAEARRAIEIDAGGRLAIPSFVEADTVLVTPRGEGLRSQGAEPTIATASKKLLENQARLAVEEWVRHGVLAMGSATHGAGDLRDARKLLNIQKIFQTRPIRIRSVFSPSAAQIEAAASDNVVKQWAASIVEKRLAGLLELEIPHTDAPFGLEHLEALIQMSVSHGFILRLRSEMPLSHRAQRLVRESGAISVIAPGITGAPSPEFTKAACVLVLRTTDILSSSHPVECARRMIDEGWAIALGSGYQGAKWGSFNPQYLLYLAREQLGMTIEEAITATTWNSACSLRMSTVAGSVEPGKQADLAILDAKDYRDLGRRPGHNDIWLTLRGGRPIYRRGALMPY